MVDFFDNFLTTVVNNPGMTTILVIVIIAIVAFVIYLAKYRKDKQRQQLHEQYQQQQLIQSFEEETDSSRLPTPEAEVAVARIVKPTKKKFGSKFGTPYVKGATISDSDAYQMGWVEEDFDGDVTAEVPITIKNAAPTEEMTIKATGGNDIILKSDTDHTITITPDGIIKYERDESPPREYSPELDQAVEQVPVDDANNDEFYAERRDLSESRGFMDWASRNITPITILLGSIILGIFIFVTVSFNSEVTDSEREQVVEETLAETNRLTNDQATMANPKTYSTEPDTTTEENPSARNQPPTPQSNATSPPEQSISISSDGSVTDTTDTTEDATPPTLNQP